MDNDEDFALRILACEDMDIEQGHILADDLVLELLEIAGLLKSAAAYSKVRKGFWYS